MSELLGHLVAQARDGLGQLVGAPGRLAEPERDVRRLAAGVLDQHPAGLHLHDAVGRVAELEDVAGHALEGEVLVQRADRHLLRQQHDVVVELVGNRAAVGDRGEARAGARRAACRSPRRSAREAPARPRRVVKPSASICTTWSNALARQLAVGRRPAHQREQLVHRPLAAGRLRRRSAGRARPAPGPAGAAHPAPGGAPHRAAPRTRPDRPATAETAGPSARPPTPWPERPTRCRNVAIARGLPIWQQRSTSPMSMPSSSDAVATSALSLPAFSRCSASRRCSAREAAVVGGHDFRIEPLREMPRDALGEPPRVHEDQRRAVLAHEGGEPVVDLGPDLGGHDRRERRGRQLDGEIPLAREAGVHDLAGLLPVAEQKADHALDRLLGRRDADAQRRRGAQRVQPLQREHQVRAALVVGERVQLVDNDRAHGARASAGRTPR